MRALLAVPHQQLRARNQEDGDVVAGLTLIALGYARGEGLDRVARELREIAEDLSRQERVREKAQTKATQGEF